ncbi:potassium transporter Kup [Kineosporia rhizophila]|uniref:potassium transporter Kup n=1 Tax=Kineosporia sp. NBRC 101677 TaxID=3032197 RepID=UPI001E54AF72|nr:potassium transporter Kup [Kineosporia sp. NBRC 101677]MCE0536552.1 potassium transporter Kup [Kineosporia rhizophila]GLY15352.1 putative potassium transport system protein kup [Kineosporia sp. NBRC 101677]
MSTQAPPAPATPSTHGPSLGRAALTIGALGVVFGDIGTSPIYTVQTIFNPEDPHPVPSTPDNVLGVISLMIWSVTLIVTLEYVTFVLRADNDGEGGILSLITLIRRRAVPGSRRTKAGLAALGIFGASLFFGDSMITPAISVLSAVEGLEVVNPSLADLTVPITAVIIVLLFLAQKFGTERVGGLFGPVMIVWFTVIGVAGIGGIVQNPEVLKALSPTYAIGFLTGHFHIAFFSMAAVVLAITGAEALYADLGHFGRPAIARAWLILVFPACLLSYLGQGALVIQDPVANLSSPFFLLVPEWARLPLVVLATAATVIASQAVITGAFSVAHQAIQLGYLPRLRIHHTSAHAIGQIYVPWINWVLMFSVLTLVVTFQSSHKLAYAFGMAVTGTITITTVLFFYLARHRWQKPAWLVYGFGSVFLLLDLLFLSANMTKLVHGAWLPVLIGISVFTVMTTWQRGRALVTARREQEEGSLREFVDALHTRRPAVVRVPGTAVFLNRGKETTPLAMRANVEHNHVLHQHAVILSIETRPVPYVPPAEQVVLDELGYADDGITHVTAYFGYMDEPDVPTALSRICGAVPEMPASLQDASYFLSTIDLEVGEDTGMPRWRKRLFVATSGITADAADYFRLPRERTVVIGSRIEV